MLLLAIKEKTKNIKPHADDTELLKTGNSTEPI